MKPIPAEGSLIDRKPIGTTILPTGSPRSSHPNRKAPVPASHRAYPLLLIAATSLAMVFCYLYLTKPVILPTPAMMSSPGRAEIVAANNPAPAMGGSLAADHLPGETPANRLALSNARAAALAKSSGGSPFEETNFQVQNVILAETPDGTVNKLNVKVPVVYRSRNLRWTKQEVASARDLLARLKIYQEKTRALHEEGVALAGAWNHLIERSIPAAGLQADSPTLPANQPGASNTPGSAPTETIHLLPAGK